MTLTACRPTPPNDTGGGDNAILHGSDRAKSCTGLQLSVLLKGSV